MLYYTEDLGSTIKMEVADSPKMAVTTYKTMQRHPQPKSYVTIN
jgi:hypothetical protein